MKPNLLSIAGYDPTGGAGVLADIKTFEAHRCKGFAVQTANTVQTENRFYTPHWITESQIVEQLHCILNNYKIHGIKIGLIPSTSFLEDILEIVRPKVKIIVWDPIVSTSSGYEFHKAFQKLESILQNIDFTTPNWDEARRWGGVEDLKSFAEKWSRHADIILKGGHHPTEKGWDFWLHKGNIRRFKPKVNCPYSKHGSGCVFSSALLANICKGYPTQKSLLKTKRYTEYFLNSDKGLLGSHKI